MLYIVYVYCWIVSDDMLVSNLLIISNTGLQSKERHYCNEKNKKTYTCKMNTQAYRAQNSYFT